MITRNETGHLQYRTIPRYDIGPAHAWECRQPAQFLTTPSELNMTELFGGVSPELLYRLSAFSGLPEEETAKWGDPKRQNDTFYRPCHFCESSKHRFFECPFAQDDSEETIRRLDSQRDSMQRELLEPGLNESARLELEDRIEQCRIRIESSKLYAHICISRGNKTWEYNRPGANWANGECSMRDAIRVTELLPPPPEGKEVRVPEHFQNLDDAVKQAKSGQTIRLAAGQHLWGGASLIPAYTEEPQQLEFAWECGAASLPAEGCVHTITTVGDGRNSTIFSRSLRMQSPALLYGRWILGPTSTGTFTGLSCYSQDGGVPGHHVVLDLEKHEEEPYEIGRRFRPNIFTATVFTVLHANWTFSRCDIFCLDGTCLSALGHAYIELSRCRVGGAGTLTVRTDGACEVNEEDGLAYIGLDLEDRSEIRASRCFIQMTQIVGIRLSVSSRVYMKGSVFALNGGMGGSALSITEHARCRLYRCKLVCGESNSPIWRDTAALEASITSASRGLVELVECDIFGNLWLTARRPRYVRLQGIHVQPKAHVKTVRYKSGREQAAQSGMKDPVMLWGDSRYEIWWPLHRVKELGYKIAPLPMDGVGQLRHVMKQDLNLGESEEDERHLCIWINRTKKIESKPWGWEGTLEDAYDTNALIKDEGRWPLREKDIEDQKAERDRVLFKRQRAKNVIQRTELAKSFLNLMSNSKEELLSTLGQLGNITEQGDLAVNLWLDEALRNQTSHELISALVDAQSRYAISDSELNDFENQLAVLEVDDLGNLVEKELMLGSLPISASSIPPAILSAVWPHWPLYPQDRNSTLSQTLIQSARQRSDDEDNEVLRPWDKKDRAICLSLENSSQISQLSLQQRWQLAESGFLPHPKDKDFEDEIKNRDVDAWFRAMSEPGDERLWLPVLRNYASAMKIELPEHVLEVHDNRRRLESELAVTEDYLNALGISSALHLTLTDWRTLYPHLDSKRLFNPPRSDKLQRVERRVYRLREKLEEALCQELELMLEVVYPMAKRVEKAFSIDDQREIDSLIKLRGDYSMEGRFADSGIRTPFTLNEDGSCVVYDELRMFQSHIP